MQLILSLSYGVIFAVLGAAKEIKHLITDLLARAYPEVAKNDYVGYAAAIENSAVGCSQKIKKYFVNFLQLGYWFDQYVPGYPGAENPQSQEVYTGRGIDKYVSLDYIWSDWIELYFDPEVHIASKDLYEYTYKYRLSELKTYHAPYSVIFKFQLKYFLQKTFLRNAADIPYSNRQLQ